MHILRKTLITTTLALTTSATVWANCFYNPYGQYTCPQQQAMYPAPYQYRYDYDREARRDRREQREQEREYRREQREREREQRRHAREQEREYSRHDNYDDQYPCDSGRCDDINRGPDKTVKGLGLGALFGAILGGVIGGNGQSAAIGAGAGALLGGSIGSNMDRNEELECQQRFLGDEYRYGQRYEVRNSSNYYVAANVGYYYGYPQSHCRQYQYVQAAYGPYGVTQQTTLVHYCYFQQGWQVVPAQYFILH